MDKLISNCESQLKPAAYERAVDQRSSWVLIRSPEFNQTHCPTAVGFLF
jgi:hypothetical protein